MGRAPGDSLVFNRLGLTHTHTLKTGRKSQKRQQEKVMGQCPLKEQTAC